MATEIDDKPPVLGSWRNVYLLLAVVLATEVALMYWLTLAFS